jgi:ferritin-like metal-binding protein YciE
MKHVESVQDLFELGLKFTYDCEQQLIKALPKMAQASTSSQLRSAFEQHLEETRRHAQRLEQVFQDLGVKADTETNDVVKNLIKEGDRMIGSIDKSPLLDAALIVAGNQVEHYEMAVYGSLRTWAELLGRTQSVRLLQETLNEEKAADQKLTQIGATSVNREALNVHAHA